MTKTLVKELSMEEENFHLENLDLIQEALENSIAAYAIQNEEDLFDAAFEDVNEGPDDRIGCEEAPIRLPSRVPVQRLRTF